MEKAGGAPELGSHHLMISVVKISSGRSTMDGQPKGEFLTYLFIIVCMCVYGTCHTVYVKIDFVKETFYVHLYMFQGSNLGHPLSHLSRPPPYTSR